MRDANFASPGNEMPLTQQCWLEQHDMRNIRVPFAQASAPARVSNRASVCATPFEVIAVLAACGRDA